MSWALTYSQHGGCLQEPQHLSTSLSGKESKYISLGVNLCIPLYGEKRKCGLRSFTQKSIQHVTLAPRRPNTHSNTSQHKTALVSDPKRIISKRIYKERTLRTLDPVVFSLYISLDILSLNLQIQRTTSTNQASASRK